MNSIQVKTFRTQKLSSAKPEDVKVFLVEVAESLKDLKDRNAAPKLVIEVGGLIYDIREKLLKNAPKNRKVEMMYGKVKGLLQGLEERIERIESNEDNESSTYGREFYTEVYELGILIDDFAAIVKAITPIVAFWNN